MNWRMSALAFESRLPVGSSAKMISGRDRERARHGNALLLTAGELRRAVRQPVAQAHRVDDAVEPLLVGVAARERHRQRDVLDRGERRDQVERLEHEPDLVPADLGELLLGELPERDGTEPHLAAREPVEAGDAVQQRRLARTRTDP